MSTLRAEATRHNGPGVPYRKIVSTLTAIKQEVDHFLRNSHDQGTEYSAAVLSFSPCKGCEVSAIAKDTFQSVFGCYGAFRDPFKYRYSTDHSASELTLEKWRPLALHDITLEFLKRPWTRAHEQTMERAALPESDLFINFGNSLECFVDFAVKAKPDGKHVYKPLFVVEVTHSWDKDIVHAKVGKMWKDSDLRGVLVVHVQDCHTFSEPIERYTKDSSPPAKLLWVDPRTRKPSDAIWSATPKHSWCSPLICEVQFQTREMKANAPWVTLRTGTEDDSRRSLHALEELNSRLKAVNDDIAELLHIQAPGDPDWSSLEDTMETIKMSVALYRHSIWAAATLAEGGQDQVDASGPKRVKLTQASGETKRFTGGRGRGRVRGKATRGGGIGGELRGSLGRSRSSAV